jgi:hypothetical protein
VPLDSRAQVVLEFPNPNFDERQTQIVMRFPGDAAPLFLLGNSRSSPCRGAPFSESFLSVISSAESMWP